MIIDVDDKENFMKLGSTITKTSEKKTIQGGDESLHKNYT